MKPFLIFVPLIVLACPASSWAAPAMSDTLLDYAPYAALALVSMSLGLTIGVLAARRRRLSLFAGAVGGLALGPLAFLLFLAPARGAVHESGSRCPECGEPLAAGASSCSGCGWSPEREVRAASSAPAKADPPKAKRKAPAARGPEAPDDLSSEFAQYSEMLRKSLPGALDRGELIDYSQKFARVAEDDSARCSNPACNRLLPPPYEVCPHCGTEQARSAGGEMRRAG